MARALLVRISKLAASIAMLLAHLGCTSPVAPASPEEALAAASARIDALVADARLRGTARLELPPMPENGGTVRFWYYAHPLIAKAFERGAAHDGGASVEAQYIGEWPAANQKLMVAFAADELPDVGMVKRGLVARLYESRRIRTLDTILPKEFMDDLRPEAVADYTYDGHLIALPADGFCSLLYFNKRSVGPNPPKTWAFLTAYVNAQHATPGPQFPRGLGYFPFMEALWSADGNVVIGWASGLDRPETRRALGFVLEITRNASVGEGPSFNRWVNGEIAMTVASSFHIPAAEKSGLDYGISPVPGETGPISRRSNDAVVLFSRDEGADAAAICAFLDWLTGPQVMGERAASDGSVPLRNSLRTLESTHPELDSAYAAARNTPLHPDWGAIESELDRALAEAVNAATAASEEKK